MSRWAWIEGWGEGWLCNYHYSCVRHLRAHFPVRDIPSHQRQGSTESPKCRSGYSEHQLRENETEPSLVRLLSTQGTNAWREEGETVERLRTSKP